MNNSTKFLFAGLGNTISVAGIVVAESVYYVVSIICAVIGLLITITTCLLIPLLKWLKKAREDGKIDENELDELSQILKEGQNEIGEKVKKNKKEGE